MNSIIGIIICCISQNVLSTDILITGYILINDYYGTSLSSFSRSGTVSKTIGYIIGSYNLIRLYS